MVYLICFNQKLSHAKHYIGCSDEIDPCIRLAYHKKGNGAKILHALNKIGIEYDIVRIWPNASWTFEKELKRYKNSWRLCPICNGTKARQHKPNQRVLV